MSTYVNMTFCFDIDDDATLKELNEVHAAMADRAAEFCVVDALNDDECAITVGLKPPTADA